MRKANLILIIFNMVKHFIAYNSCRYLKVTEIEEDEKSGDFLITFFMPQKMSSISIKSVKEIMEDDELINKFNPVDASTIGNLLAKSQYKKILKIRGEVNVKR